MLEEIFHFSMAVKYISYYTKNIYVSYNILIYFDINHISMSILL